MRAVALLAVSVLVLGSTRISRAETIWERVKWGAKSEERQMRESVEKVLLGVGDERDLLQVRVGLITLSRGEVQDPRTIVLLLRLRREMGLTPSRYTEVLLERARQGDLSLSERAWAQLELAHNHLSRRDLPRAHEALSAGLELAWRTQVRAEISMLRGLVHLRSGRGPEAMDDFSVVITLAPSRRVVVQAQIGQALAFTLRGDRERLREAAKQAFITEATRATVSRLDPFWDLELTDLENENARALLLFGRALVLENDEPPDAYRARVAACSLLDPPSSRPDAPQDDRIASARPWGAEIRRSLRVYFEETCLLPPPAEIQIEPSEDGSATGDHEDDL